MIRDNSCHRTGRGIDVRGAKAPAQHVLPAGDVQRKVAVAPVVAVEEAALLMAMQAGHRSRRGPIRSLRAPPRWVSINKSTSSASIASQFATIFLYRCVAAASGVPSSRRFNVLDPASGWPRSRSRTRDCPRHILAPQRQRQQRCHLEAGRGR